MVLALFNKYVQKKPHQAQQLTTARFKVLTAVLLKIHVFRNVTQGR
jgi:hypothetical protein